MSLGRLVPWISWDEWDHVGTLLYDESKENNMKGIEIVSAWRIRGRVPVGVESTALIREVMHSDAAQAVSEALLRLQYSLALVRFVNGVADSAQKSKVALSVASLANQSGIPKLLVDLRHESTHNELPSLSVLRIAAKQALEWLEGKYWEAQRGHLQACMKRLDDIVLNYVRSHLVSAAKEAASNRKGSKLDGDFFQEIVDGAVRGDGLPAPHLDQYDGKQWKKYRQCLVTELRTLVPRGGMVLLVRSLLHCDFATSLTNTEMEMGNTVARLICRRVLKQFEQEWIGISLLALHEVIDSLFQHVLRGKHLKHETDVWFEVCLEAVESKCIKNLISDFIRTYSSSLKKQRIKWYVQAIDQPSLEALLKLSSCLQILSSHAPDAQSRKACDQFIDVYLDVSRDDISKDVKVWNIEKSKRKLEMMDPDVQGKPDDGKRRTAWHVAKTWQPCAIGTCPSLIDPNGILPDIPATEKDGKKREIRQLESVINETRKHPVFDLAPSTGFIPNQPADRATDTEILENRNDTSSDQNSLSIVSSHPSMRSDDGETESEPMSCHEQGTCLPPSRLLE